MRGDSLKQSMRFKKLLTAVIVLIITITATAVLPTEVYSAKPKAEIEMEVQAGFGGVARLGAYIPYKILLINKGRAVEGEVQVEVKIDSNSKTVFARPFSLPEASTKEIMVNAPVFTAKRGIQVKVREDGKTVKEMEYTFAKLIPPDMKVIGVLSPDNAAYGFLNGIKLPEPDEEEYEEKVRVMRASGVYSTSSRVVIRSESSSVKKAESVLIPLAGEDMPEDIKVMNGFNILIISNFDTGTLSQEQLSVLEKWIENGGTLVLGTGVNWKKVYEALPKALKKFTVTGTKSVGPPAALADFSGAGFSGSVNLDMVSGRIGFEYKKKEKEEEKQDEEKETDDKKKEKQVEVFSTDTNEVIIGDGDNPLAVKYIHQTGRILFLAFDPGMEPIAGWEGKQAFWQNLLFHSANNRHLFNEEGPGYYYSSYNEIYNFNGLTEQVPEEKKPPFLFMFITIAVYIIIAGPVLYIFLKKKDRRDINWLAVPAAALVCLSIIYLVGFQTRYKTAVLNTASLIHLDAENQKADIVTGMGIFNNRRGNLKLTYPQNNNIDFNIAESGDREYITYPNGKEPEGKTVSKLIFTEPINYELYDVAMWEPKYLTAKKSEPLQDKLINSVQIKDEKFKAVIKNTTQYEFMDAFITIGSNFISAGDILPGHEAVVEADLNSENVYRSFEAYLTAQYGRSSYPASMKPPADFPEKRRKREIIQSLLRDQYYSLRGQAKIGLYALNYQDMGYKVEINGEQSQAYHTNSVFSSTDIQFEKGKEVEIPAGIVLPYLEEDVDGERIASLDSDNGVRVRNEGDIDFTYTLPEDIQLTEFSLKFDTYVPLNVKYNIEIRKQKDKNFQAKILQNQYEYYLYNKVSDTWEKIEDTHTQVQSIDSYIDAEKKLKVRVKVVKMAEDDSESDDEYVQSERLAFPKLQLKGVAR